MRREFAVAAPLVLVPVVTGCGSKPSSAPSRSGTCYKHGGLAQYLWTGNVLVPIFPGALPEVSQLLERSLPNCGLRAIEALAPAPA